MTPASTTQFTAADTNVILLLRLEGAVALGASIFAYAWLGQSWLVFAVLFLAPDLAMLGYLRSVHTGTLSYNLVHTYVAPAVLALAGLLLGPWAFGLAAIWAAHIAADRVLGFGIKLGGSFDRTHLSPNGKTR